MVNVALQKYLKKKRGRNRSRAVVLKKAVLPPEDIWQYLETILIVIVEKRVLMASHGWKPGVLLNYPIISRTAPTIKNYPCRMLVVPRVGDPGWYCWRPDRQLGKVGSEAHLFDYRPPQGPLGWHTSDIPMQQGVPGFGHNEWCGWNLSWSLSSPFFILFPSQNAWSWAITSLLPVVHNWSYEQTADVLPFPGELHFKGIYEEQEGLNSRMEWDSKGSGPFLALEYNSWTVST